ncbi:MAG: hypothetical protein VX910_00960, partial [Candidatus Latescibacterota bacterium]|nr:hypothetical protein [Candidatus Latescibacterota bacterium]
RLPDGRPTFKRGMFSPFPESANQTSTLRDQKDTDFVSGTVNLWLSINGRQGGETPYAETVLSRLAFEVSDQAVQ